MLNPGDCYKPPYLQTEAGGAQPTALNGCWSLDPSDCYKKSQAQERSYDQAQPTSIGGAPLPCWMDPSHNCYGPMTRRTQDGAQSNPMGGVQPTTLGCWGLDPSDCYKKSQNPGQATGGAPQDCYRK